MPEQSMHITAYVCFLHFNYIQIIILLFSNNIYKRTNTLINNVSYIYNSGS